MLILHTWYQSTIYTVRDYWFLILKLTFIRGCPLGVMVKAMVCEIVAREFELQSRYYVHFRTNTTGKGMNPLPAMG